MLNDVRTFATSTPVCPPGPNQAHRANKTLYARWGKRTFDLALIVMSLPALLPIFLIVTILSMLDGHVPFYVQDRIGRHGKTFRMFKFRTMVVDADAKLEAYLASDPRARQEWDLHQKLINDPRITPAGNFLRKSSLDELPQILNVILGDMSLFGPRPMMSNQRDLYKGTAYFMMRPGLSGPWQVSARNSSTFAARVKFDEDYFRDLSFKTDFDLLLKTFQTIARGTGC